MADPDELLLAIDCGTQSVRALLIDLDGAIVAKRQHALNDYKSLQDNWLEYDAEAFWRAAASVCRDLWRAHGDLNSRTKGLVRDNAARVARAARRGWQAAAAHYHLARSTRAQRARRACRCCGASRSRRLG